VTKELIGINPDGFPKSVDFLQKYLTYGPKGIQYVLTLLVCSRSMEFKREPDYSSITDPFTGTDDNLPQSDIEKIVKDFDLGLELPM
jgi:hypothetical protein